MVIGQWFNWFWCYEKKISISFFVAEGRNSLSGAKQIRFSDMVTVVENAKAIPPYNLTLLISPPILAKCIK